MSQSGFVRKYRAYIAAATFVAVAGGAYVAIGRGSVSEAAVTYETEAVSVGTISVTVAGTGNIEVDGTTEVYAPVAGKVASVAVTEGSLVTTGSVLFRLDEATAEANTAKALASLRQAEQTVSQARLQVTKAQNALATLRARSTEASSTVAGAEVAAAEGEVAVAKAQLASAQAQSTTASIAHGQAVDDENDLTITAPCSGIVYALEAAEGDSVTAGSGGSSDAADSTGMGATAASSSSFSAPVTIAPEQPLAVHLTVNEVDLPSLEIGQRADVEFDAFPNLTATGKIYSIGSEGSNSSGVVTFDVWISLDVADPALRSGMSAAATIVTNVAKGVLVVPNSALQSDGDGGYYVQVMWSGFDEPQQVAVETGLASTTDTQILAGLAEGDTVITRTMDTSEQPESEAPGGGMMVPGMGGFRD